MKYSWLILLLLLAVVAVPSAARSAVPDISDVELIDVNNDDGTAIGVLWNWSGEVGENHLVTVQIELLDGMLEQYALTDQERERLDAALEELKATLEPVLPELEAATVAEAESAEALTLAVNNKEDTAADLRRQNWVMINERNRWQHQLERARDRFLSRIGDLEDDARLYDFIAATMAELQWANSNIAEQAAADIETKADRPDRFGHHPADPELNYLEINLMQVINPDVLDGTHVAGLNEYGIESPKVQQVPLRNGQEYTLKMVVTELADGEVVAEREFPLGTAMPKTNYFDNSKFNNLLFTVVFTVIILSAIMIARRNPNLFIRRIQGLEAVDEAIGRATEMGKPVLYLCGLDSLATLSTLAAVNILGRVARRVADYDSDLVVPCRDPVVLTVAQEVAKEAYIDRGRPDAFREDKIFFVTDDQFSYTATTCAIMMREKPAANFFMGYYYAESLLLAETGASTGAIQIAGTDATHQLPFFITTCDYTLIGEELYAASAYMSREPMLLGSLKGQDVGKALMMLFIIVQTALFLISPEWDWLRLLVEPL
jgi:hypothetical protein